MSGMREELNRAVDAMHGKMREALLEFTVQTGLMITATTWDCGEVLNASGDGLDPRYMRLRSRMDTKQS